MQNLFFSQTKRLDWEPNIVSICILVHQTAGLKILGKVVRIFATDNKTSRDRIAHEWGYVLFEWFEEKRRRQGVLEDSLKKGTAAVGIQLCNTFRTSRTLWTHESSKITKTLSQSLVLKLDELRCMRGGCREYQNHHGAIDRFFPEVN